MKDKIADTFFVTLLVLLVLIPMKYELRYIETGSMEPGIRVGAIVLIDPKAYEDSAPQVGDVAMYQTATREVIHRIIRTEENGYKFKGDNNKAEDFGIVPRDAIRGKLVLRINLVAPLIRAIKNLEG